VQAIWEEIKAQYGYNNWQERMKRRGNAFFQIVTTWVEYVERTIIVAHEVDWA
jgi:hypothetical protein